MRPRSALSSGQMAAPQSSDYHSLMIPDATVIYPSREKQLLLACFGAGFVGLGFFLLRSASIGERLIGLASILFFGLGTLYHFVRIARRTPALILHPSGVFIHGTGFLRWEEISDIFVTRIQRQPFLAIDVKDVDALLSRQSWPKARLTKRIVAGSEQLSTFPPTHCPCLLRSLSRNMQQKFPAIQVAG